MRHILVSDSEEYVSKKLASLESALHNQMNHPDWEYETVRFPLKSSLDLESSPPEGSGWVINIHKGSDGWVRCDFYEEMYWMREKSKAPFPDDDESYPELNKLMESATHIRSLQMQLLGEMENVGLISSNMKYYIERANKAWGVFNQAHKILTARLGGGE